MSLFDHCPDRYDTHSFKYSPSVMKARLGQDGLQPLWVADMDFQCPPPVIKAIKARADHGIFGYSTMGDDREILEVIRNWMLLRFQWEISEDWILYSPGVVNSMFYLVSALCEPGDRVLIQNPVYPPFRSLIKDAGCQWVDNRMQWNKEKRQYEMDLEDLEHKVSDPLVKVFLLCSPSNPGGRVWTVDELRAISDICKRHGVFVVSDEIHADLTYPGVSHIPWGKIDGSGNWAVLVSPSKTFNIPGLGTSFAIIPNEKVRQQFLRKKYSNHGAMENPFGLVAAKAAYQEAAPWLDELRIYLNENYRIVQKNLPEVFIPAVQEATYLSWIDASQLGSAEQIRQFFYHERNLGVQMGSDFGPGGTGFIRLNFAIPRDLLKKVMDIICS